MQQVNIHSGAIGTGKTTQWIIPSIQKDIEQGLQIILAVPSQTSQNILAQHFNQNDCLVINCDYFTGKVVDTFKSHIASTVFKILIITHDALKLCNLNEYAKNNWTLYIDEVINPYNRVPFWASSEDGVKVNWADFITLTEETNKSYIKVNAVMPSDSWSYRIPELKDLTDISYTTWTTQAEYDKFAKGKGCVEFAQELNIDILKGWKSINIAAASFETTYMYKWMTNNGYSFNIISPFVKTEINAEVYTTSYFNSATLQTTHPEVIKMYNKEMKNIFNEEEIIRLVNKGTNKTKFKNEYILPHNVAGQNIYNHITNASFEAANNNPPMMNNWMKEANNFTDDEIILGNSAYLAYQFYGRSIIRNYNGTLVKLGCICNKVMSLVFTHYYNNANDNSFNILDNVVKVIQPKSKKEDPKLYYQSGPKKGQRKKAPLTSTERSAKSRAKKERYNIANGVK